MSATAWSAIDVRPVTASAAFQSPRALTTLSAGAVRRSSAGFAGTAPILPSGRRTPRTSAQLTWFVREIDRSRFVKRRASRRDGGVGSGRVRLSQMTGAAPRVSFASWAAVAGRARRWAAGLFARGTSSTYGDFACERFAAGRGFAAGFGAGGTRAGGAAGGAGRPPPPPPRGGGGGGDRAGAGARAGARAAPAPAGAAPPRRVLG